MALAASFPVLLLSVSSVAAGAPSEAEKLIQSYEETDQYSGKLEMNGVRLADYKDFFSWNLVTVRYRTDTHEQRFTYANALAWKALLESSKDYPDGAVFAKVGYLGQPDEAFESSVVPSGLRRVQIMVRDKAKYRDTLGWGFGLFKMDGTTFAGNPKSKALECAACHKIVWDRGFVFSQPIDKTPVIKRMTNYISRLKPINAEVSPGGGRIEFKDRPLTDFAESQLLRMLIPGRFQSARLVVGDLSKSTFVGTYNEMVPSLVKEALHSGKPAALVNEKFQSLFSLVYPMEMSEMKCGAHQQPLFVAMAVPPYYFQKSLDFSNLEVRKICAARLDSVPASSANQPKR